jgi:hypothetical protein
MDERQKKWVFDVLATHNSNMFKTLLYEEHLVSKNLKYIEEFKREEDGEPLAGMKGYFATKDMTKYWLDESYGGKNARELLPLRVGEDFEVMTLREDVVYRVLNPVPFKIVPEVKIPVRELLFDMLPFSHSNPDQWLLAKIVAISGYVSQDFVTVCSPSAFGKTAVYKALHYLTSKCPVYKPRSVPGALAQITGTGNMVFDEAQKCDSKIREVMEDLSLRLADGSKDYINGALKSALTKTVYDCPLQSVTYLYNTIEQYQNPEKDYFDVVWVNPGAMRDRFLQLKFDGVLTQEFNKGFDVVGTADENLRYYMFVAKTLLALQELKVKDGYKRRFERTNYVPVVLSNRQSQTYENLTWIIDLVCHTPQEYNRLCSALDKCIVSYRDMVSGLLSGKAEPKINQPDLEVEDVIEMGDVE